MIKGFKILLTVFSIFLFQHIGYSQSITVNSTYRFTPTGEPIVFRIVDNSSLLDSNDYSNVSGAKVGLSQWQAQGHASAYIIETTLTKSEASQKGITLTPSLYEQTLSSSKMAVSESAINLWNQAMAYYSTSSTNIAIRSLAQMIQQYPARSEIPSAKYYLGTIYYGRYFSRSKNKTDQYGQWENLRAAYQLFNDVITNYPNDSITPSAQLQLGYCKQAMAQFGLNTNYADKIADAVDAFKKAVDSQSDTDINAKAKAQMMYCNYLFELGVNNKLSWDTIRFELSRVTTLYPSENKGYGARCSLMESETYFYEYNRPKLIERCQALIQTYPTSTVEIAWAKFWIARAYFQDSKYTSALILYDDILQNCKEEQSELFPKLIAISLCDKAVINWSTGHQEDADTLFQQIVQRFPNTIESKFANECLKNKTSDPHAHPVLVQAPAINGLGAK